MLCYCSNEVSNRKYLVNTVSLHSKLPPKALRGVNLGAVLGQFALVVVSNSRLSRYKDANVNTCRYLKCCLKLTTLMKDGKKHENRRKTRHSQQEVYRLWNTNY